MVQPWTNRNVPLAHRSSGTYCREAEERCASGLARRRPGLQRFSCSLAIQISVGHRFIRGCQLLGGLVEEAQHSIGEQDGKGPILDLVIVAGMQRIEHYEIAAYGTDIALAEALGEQKVVDLLTATLEEEKQTDLKLTEVTTSDHACRNGRRCGRGSSTRKKPARAKAG